MARTALASLVNHLRRLHYAAAVELSDYELLQQFAIKRDEAAFEALVRRHASLVWSVCRRLLDNEHDAEDAFQAVFLVLLRKSAALRVGPSLANWLHSVASRIAQKSRVTLLRRRLRERRAETPNDCDPFASVESRDLRTLLDEELDRLPEKYRAPLVLCYLEGLSYAQAARQLGWRDGTLCGRLARARELLRQRLTRRGLTLTGAALLAGMTESSSAPAATLAAVTRMASLFTLGEAVAGAVPLPVATLAQNVLHATSIAKIKMLAILVVALGLLTAGVGLAASHFLALKPPQTEYGANAFPDKPEGEKKERTDLYGDPLPPGALLRLGTVRFRNRDGIGQIVYSPDSKILAVGDFYGGIVLYDAGTGRKIRQFRAFSGGEFLTLAFAPDGKTLAAAGTRTIQLWDLAAGKELRRYRIKAAQAPNEIPFRKIVPLVFSHNGKMLASGAPDRSIHVWEVNTGKELVKLCGHEKPIRCLAFSADDNKLVSASAEFLSVNSVRVWQLKDGKQIRKFSFPRPHAALSEPELLCLSPDGRTFVFAVLESQPLKKAKGGMVASTAYMVAFFDLETGRERRKLGPVAGESFKTAAFSADGKILAAMNGVRTIVGNFASEDANRLHVWETATGKLMWDVPAYSENVHQGPCCLAFSPDGKKLAASSTASSLHVWDVQRGREDPELSEAHHDGTVCVAFAPDGQTLASGSFDRTIALWDAATGKQRQRLDSHDSQVSSLAFSPDGKLLASACRFNGQTLQLWDLTSGKELRRYLMPFMKEGQVLTSVDTWVAFTAKGKVLAAGSSDRKLRLWDVATGKQLFNQHMRGSAIRPTGAMDDWKDRVRAVAFTPDGRTMALTMGQTIHVADVAAGQRLFHFEKDGNTTFHLALSPDGKTLACGGRSHSFRLVEIASGKDLYKLDTATPNYDEILALAFAPDGRTVAVAAGKNHGWIYLFDVPTGKQRLRLQGAACDVNGLSFSPDGNKLASAQNDCTTLVWDVVAARLKLPRKDLTAKDLERLWNDLRDAEVPKAHAALWTLVAAPDKSVPFLKEHLHPVPRIPAERLHRLIADLDADDFARREEASRSLAKLGSEAEPALRKALDDKPALELRRRVQALLDGLTCQTEMTPDALRQLRAIQVLEQIGTPEARQVLASLAKGAPAAPATRDAAAALARLHR